uniref:Sperm associated antigen 7 n=1 Tax=Eptatretus burgeri TaxID=7764 RepID=A0A8C4NKP5_EPTBU
MADLLGSLLNSMQTPPGVGQSRQVKEQRARLEKLQQQEKRYKSEFRKKMELAITEFIQDASQQRKQFDNLGRLERTILHDVAEVADLASMAFGDDEELKQVLVYKKEFSPSEEELDKMRGGVSAVRVPSPSPSPSSSELQPRPQRRSRGIEARLRAGAQTLTAREVYGCVPAANKRDTRSIEQTLHELKERKKLRLDTLQDASVPSPGSQHDAEAPERPPPTHDAPDTPTTDNHT